jgi:CBS domain containing-hemolysin-like protein
MEIAFISSNKLKLELDRNQKNRLSKVLTLFFNNPTQYIATMLVGNNISLVIFGLFSAKLLEPFITIYTNNSALILTTQTIFSTLIVLFFAEFIPKAIFRILPNSFLNIFAYPVLIFYYLLYLIAAFSIGVSNFFLKYFVKKDYTNEENNTPVFNKVDIDSLFLSREEKIHIDEEDEIDVQLFQNALDFSSVKLRDCIVPRTDIEAVSTEDLDNIDKLTQLFVETGFSRILVYKETIDNIIGYIHSSDLFKKSKEIEHLIHEVKIATETMSAEKLLQELLAENKNIAIVVDEFGGTAGMVTVEDIIEEIFGEIEDEFDAESELEIQVDENTFLFSARLEIDYINKKYLLDLEESDEYETLAGFILNHYNNIPKLNDTLQIEDFEIKITDVNNTRIEAVQLTKK